MMEEVKWRREVESRFSLCRGKGRECFGKDKERSGKDGEGNK